ncbi:hypothetical protein GCM10023336_55900 [Streptomyces similanensis]|uniref:Uncharacterized protein n=1 Tax=Streptomyces similanensis TaxID=1274988 RepID=A0ABP9L577_9ACTN
MSTGSVRTAWTKHLDVLRRRAVAEAIDVGADTPWPSLVDRIGATHRVARRAAWAQHAAAGSCPPRRSGHRRAVRPLHPVLGRAAHGGGD